MRYTLWKLSCLHSIYSKTKLTGEHPTLIPFTIQFSGPHFTFYLLNLLIRERSDLSLVGVSFSMDRSSLILLSFTYLLLAYTSPVLHHLGYRRRSRGSIITGGGLIEF